jgi:predicted aldo/keto reductase-like oxidoreductase
MTYRTFGSTGLEISALGFGSMRLPLTNIGSEQYVDIDRAVEVIRHAFELGVNYIDSGLLYCSQQSEIAVGRALRGWREKVTVTTKATKNRMANRGDLRRMLDHQLQRMEIDYFDFYCFHGVGWENFHAIDEKTGWIADMTRAKDEGLVKRIGFSFHDEPENMKKLIDLGCFEMVTCQYNYLDQRNADSMAYAHEKGLGVVVMGPVGGGRLAGLPGFLRDRDDTDVSNASALALRFVLSNPSVHVALSGMGSVEMVAQNAAAVEAGPLSAADLEALNRLVEKTRKLADLYCTGCGYCMPCEHGVNIPRRFEAMNYYKVYGLEDHARTTYRQTRERDAKTDGGGECVACGECEKKCPQKLPIIDQLGETEAALASGAE